MCLGSCSLCVCVSASGCLRVWVGSCSLASEGTPAVGARPVPTDKEGTAEVKFGGGERARCPVTPPTRPSWGDGWAYIVKAAGAGLVLLSVLIGEAA